MQPLNSSNQDKSAEERKKVIKKSVFKRLSRKLNQLQLWLGRKCNQPLILSVNSPHKTKWDLFVMVLATYNCF
jgi:potassium channel